MDIRKREKYLYLIKKGILMECLLAMVLATLVTVKRNTYDKESASNALLTIEDDYI